MIIALCAFMDDAKTCDLGRRVEITRDRTGLSLGFLVATSVP